MSVQSLLHGYIKEAWPGVSAGGDPAQRARLNEVADGICRHNDTVLGALPDRDEWPPICRPMFAWPTLDDPMIGMIAFRARLFHFAACQNQLDRYLSEWLEKFEGLLRRLYWEDAFVRVETGYIGTHEFRWRPADAWVTSLCKADVGPIDEWSYTGTIDRDELARL